jgi:hypothetical protein
LLLLLLITFCFAHTAHTAHTARAFFGERGGWGYLVVLEAPHAIVMAREGERYAIPFGGHAAEVAVPVLPHYAPRESERAKERPA